MDIPINAKVSCVDGPCGRSVLVIIKPVTQEVTHLVVSDESTPETEYLVDTDHILESTPDHISLRCSRDELAKMPVFARAEFIPADVTGLSGGAYMMWPYYPLASSFITLEKEQIPEDELAIRRGARVQASDGRVGHVDEFLINPENDHITHLVMREGHFWEPKDVTIPVSEIDHFQDDTVYLKLSKQEIGKLPAIPVKRGGSKSS